MRLNNIRRLRHAMACLTCVKGLVCKFNFDSVDSLRRLLRITRHVEHFVDMVEPAVLLAVRSEAIGTQLAEAALHPKGRYRMR